MLYEKLIESRRFKIDLRGRNLWLNGKQVVKDGDINEEDLIDGNWERVEELYQQFKHSVPSSNWQDKYSYFKALSVDELTDAELAFNMDRQKAQAMLEGYLLFAKLPWSEYVDHWFWQSSNDKDLVVLKSLVNVK